jgi:hypothetical protein
MIAYGPEKAHLIPHVQAVLKEQMREDVRAGIYDAYSKLIDMVVSSSLLDEGSDMARMIKFLPSGGVEQPLLARYGRHMDPGVFRLTLSRVDPNTLENEPHSTLTIATVKPVRQFEEVGETFTIPQIELVARHAFEIINIDGVIATFGIKEGPGLPGPNA